MGGWAWMIWTAVGAGAVLAAVSGGLLLAFAVAGRRRVECVMAAESPEGACDCCGYALAGLENGYCPECGWRYAENRRLPRWRRVRAGVAGLVLLVMAGGAGVATHGVHHGAASVMPTTALIAVLPMVEVGNGPVDRDTSVHRALRMRADERRMWGWQRRWLASRCAGLLCGPCDESRRVAAAELMASVAADGPGATVLGGMGDPSAAVRCAVVGAVAARARGTTSAARAEAVQRMLGAAICDPSERVRRTAVDSLARVSEGAPGAAGVFARTARDPSALVRMRAMYALYARGSTANAGASELATVVLASRDGQEGVREAAVYAMSRLAERLDGAVLLLGLSLGDSSPEVRRSAASCIARLGPRAMAVWPSVMARIAVEEDAETHAAVVAALSAMGGATGS